ncbi:hypothetical protein Tco_0428123 [Tanacetum coccineum]
MNNSSSIRHFKADYPAIVYNDALTSNENASSEPTTLADRTRMEYNGEDGQVLLTSHAWRRLFEIRGPLVQEFTLEFFSGARCRMTWGEFILALGLHSAKEIAEDGFEAYWLISCSISGRDQVPEKVTTIDLFYPRRMDQGTTNVPYLLAQYLYRNARGRKRGARMFRRYFIGRVAEYFGLVSDEGLMGLYVIAPVLLVINLDELVKLNICFRLGDTWAWVASGLERQPIAAAGALEVDEG